MEFNDVDKFGKLCHEYQVLIDCPDGENWGTRTVREYPDGSTYNCGYRASGTWVDAWWD